MKSNQLVQKLGSKLPSFTGSTKPRLKPEKGARPRVSNLAGAPDSLIPKLPRLIAGTREGIGRRHFQMERTGNLCDQSFRAALERPRIAKDHSPSPDFAIARQNHADRPMDARRCGMAAPAAYAT